MADYENEKLSEEVGEIIDEVNQQLKEGEAPAENAVSELMEEIEEVEAEEDKMADESEEEGLAETLKEESESTEEDSEENTEAAEGSEGNTETEKSEEESEAAEAEGEDAEAEDKPVELPSIELLEKELSKEKYRTNYAQVLKSTIFYLLVVAAVAVIIAVFIMPVLQISGTSMTDTLDDGDIVLAISTKKFETGDVIAFYYNNNILIKRVIAKAGDWVDIDQNGEVYVNGQHLDEPYVTDKAFGDCNIKLPYQVPESRIFVMGDNRDVSVDSRNTSVGCVAEEQIVGKIVFCIWPFSRFGKIQ